MDEIHNVALRLLARRDHTKLELRRKLETREYLPEEIDPILFKLEKEGWIDEPRFAENYLRMRMNQGKGVFRIRKELQERGIVEELIQAAMEVIPEETWQELAETVRQKKFGSKPVKDFKEKAKQQRFLQYRGFSSSQIRFAMDSI